MSTQPLLSTLHKGMSDGEQFIITLTKNGSGMDLLLVPKLRQSESEIPDSASHIRAALAVPLSLKGFSVGDIDDALIARITKYSTVRNAGTDAFNELVDSIHDATADAKNKTTAQNKANEKDPIVGKDGVGDCEHLSKPSAEAEKVSEPSETTKNDHSGSSESQSVLDFLD